MKKINCILLIDDSEWDNVYHQIIIDEAYVTNHLKIAFNGVEALEYLKKSADPDNSDSFPKPDIIFLDINMPKMNGFEFLEEYHTLNEKLKLKNIIIMLSTSFNPDDNKRAIENKEVKEFENKPLTIERIKELIEKYF